MKDAQTVRLAGKVTAFKGNGRKLGYPTANLVVATDLSVTDGVYFGFADLAKWTHHPAMIFVGIPTTLEDKQRRIEAHLLDVPDRDYYGQQLTLSFMHYHRANQTFTDVDELVTIMRADEAAARQWFAIRELSYRQPYH